MRRRVRRFGGSQSYEWTRAKAAILQRVCARKSVNVT